MVFLCWLALDSCLVWGACFTYRCWLLEGHRVGSLCTFSLWHPPKLCSIEATAFLNRSWVPSFSTHGLHIGMVNPGGGIIFTVYFLSVIRNLNHFQIKKLRNTIQFYNTIFDFQDWQLLHLVITLTVRAVGDVGNSFPPLTAQVQGRPVDGDTILWIGDRCSWW